MTPPEAPKDGKATPGETPPAASSCSPAGSRGLRDPQRPGATKMQSDPSLPPALITLTNRKDFLAASRARRQGTSGMMVQARKRRADEPAAPEAMRVGFTCSKKVGNAVARNHAKRRLREVARAVLNHQGRSGWDYVLIGRAGATAARPFEDLKSDLIYALKKLHESRK